MWMKALLAPLYLLLLANSGSGQTVAVQLDKMNVLYVGIGNPIRAAAENVPNRSLEVTTDNGRIEKDPYLPPGRYTIWPEHPGKATISVRQKTRKGLKTIGEMICRVKSIPPPIARLAGKHSGELEQSFLLVQIAPCAYLENFDFDAKFTIVDFTLSVSRHDRIIYSHTVHDDRGARIDAESNDFFHRLKEHDELKFGDIVCRNYGGKFDTLEPMKFIIINTHKYRRVKVDEAVKVIDPITGMERKQWVDYQWERKD